MNICLNRNIPGNGIYSGYLFAARYKTITKPAILPGRPQREYNSGTNITGFAEGI